MFIFIRLLLAHLIGDYILQFNRIYRLKSKGLKGVTVHVLLIVVCLFVFSWPYLNLPGIWVFIIFVGITHIFQDHLKIRLKVKNNPWFYLLDQFIHIGIISTILLTGFKNLPPPQKIDNLIISIYNNDALIIYLIAIILASYNGFFMIIDFKRHLLKAPYHFTILDKWYGITERAVIVSLLFLKGPFLFLLLPVLLARPLIFVLGNKRFNIDKQFISASEVVLSWTVAIVTSIVFYIILQRI